MPHQEIESSSESECESDFLRVKKASEKSDKRFYGSSKYEEDFRWLYYSQAFQGWMCKICEKYPYNGGTSKGAFSARPCKNTTHPTHAFKQHELSDRHKRLELKESCAIGDSLANAELFQTHRKHVNNLYLRKTVHTIFYMVKKNIALSENYGDFIKFIAHKLEEPITQQYLDTCPQNATYTSNTAAESLLDAMNFYFEQNNLKNIKEALYLCLYADESENSSHKESFSMFVTYYCVADRKVKTSFLGIVNLHGKTAAQIMDTIKLFFMAKQITLKKVTFSVLDGTNSMSGKKTGLQRRIRHYSPHNIYINCRNHRLALCLPHLMKKPEFAEMLLDYDAVLFGTWKMFHYSPKKGYVF